MKSTYNLRSLKAVEYYKEKIVGKASNDRRTYNRSQTFVSKAELRNTLDQTRNVFSSYVTSVAMEKAEDQNKSKDQQKAILKLGRTIRMQKVLIEQKNEEIKQLKTQMRLFIYEWTNSERS